MFKDSAKKLKRTISAKLKAIKVIQKAEKYMEIQLDDDEFNFRDHFKAIMLKDIDNDANSAAFHTSEESDANTFKSDNSNSGDESNNT